MDKRMNYVMIHKCGRKLSDLDVMGGICPWCHKVIQNADINVKYDGASQSNTSNLPSACKTKGTRKLRKDDIAIITFFSILVIVFNPYLLISAALLAVMTWFIVLVVYGHHYYK